MLKNKRVKESRHILSDLISSRVILVKNDVKIQQHSHQNSQFNPKQVKTEKIDEAGKCFICFGTSQKLSILSLDVKNVVTELVLKGVKMVDDSLLVCCCSCAKILDKLSKLCSEIENLITSIQWMIRVNQNINGKSDI